MSRTRIGRAFVWYLLVFALTAGNLQAGAIGEAGPSPSAAGLCPGPVAIRVKRADDGKPVPGALPRLGGRYMTTTVSGEAIFDGVPDGEHRLSIRMPGFQTLDRIVTLPPGGRDPIDVVLEPDRRGMVTGKVLLEGLGAPLAGARLALTPLSVPSTIQGPIECRTDWEGNFTILNVPEGTYKVNVRADGCRDLETVMDITVGEEQHRFSMERLFEPAALQVEVRDAVGGAPVAGAAVVLAEAYPWGEIARATTGPDGVASFVDLKVGTVNWSDAAGKCAVSRRQVTVHVEAATYAPFTDPVTLGAATKAKVSLYPVREVREQEPNDVIGNAQAIDVGSVVQLTLPERQDHDWFRFRLPHPGRLVIEVGPSNPVQTFLWLIDPQGTTLAESGAFAGTSNVIDRQVSEGEYRIHVTEWNNDDRTDVPMTLKVSYTPVPDPLSPNEDVSAARLLRVNEEVRGYQHPRGDTDCYRFTARRPGAVRISMPPSTFQRYVRLLDQGGRSMAERGTFVNDALVIHASIVPGSYVIEVTEWNRDECSLDPCSLRLEVIEDDGIDDTPVEPGPPAWGRALAPDGLVGNTIFPRGDLDHYMVPLPGPGVFRAGATAVHQTYLRLLAPDGRRLVEAGAFANEALSVEYHADQAQTVFLEVTEWNSDEAVPSPYTLWTSWIPGDELDFMGRNDGADDATPFGPGETLRGTFLPIRDVDLFRFDVDHPGWFDISTSSATQIFCRVLDAKRRRLGEWGQFANQILNVSLPLLPGEYYLEAREWNDDDWSPAPYEIRTSLRRADPDERVPLASDPVRALRPGEARPFKIEHLGDRERFQVDLPAAGSYVLATQAPFQRFIIVSDLLQNKELFRTGLFANQHHEQTIEVKGPTRLLMDVTEWNSDESSMEDGFLMVATPGQALVGERLLATIDRTDPTLVHFRREELAPHRRATRVMLDADGDGRPELELPAGGEIEYRYPAQGIHAAEALLEGEGGVVGRSRTWVEAVGYRERKGIYLLVNHPGPGTIIETDGPIRASAISYSGSRIDRVEATIDGRPAGTTHTTPYQIEVPWDELGPGEHVLSVTATDLEGDSAVQERRFQVSEFFELVPRDGAQVTGQAVTVSWGGRAFGPASLRFRKAGEKDWTGEIQAPSARTRRLSLEGLEPGVPYEIQPVGTADGPVRTVTRVKGLAFGRTKYSATIRRDYDQKLGVSVRNHGEKPLTVRLECGRPPGETKLLVGFVGEGSEGAPFELNPGQEREFLLGLSAQDCVAPQVSFPIRLVSVDTGISDESQVDLEVILPRVDLVWETKGEIPGGIGKILVLRNQGDTLTDLAVSTSSTAFGIHPSISHGMLPAGQSLEFRMVPRLHEGFQSVEGSVIASAVNKSMASEQKVALAEGERIHAVDLMPRSGDTGTDELRRERSLAAAYLNPASVDWSRKTDPQDSDGDGKIDRWFVDVPAESTRWIGLDTSGDGEIDTAQADIGPDGTVDFAALKRSEAWEETNLVDSHLEMGFKLPWARSAYEKHDVDVVMNGTVVGTLRDMIPEGNYTFRVPPAVFRFDEDGSAADNAVRIQSKHLRGGHYVVSSDFRMKLKLTGTRVYAAAKSQAEAETAVRSTPGLVLDAPDLSISSEEMRVRGEPKSGSPITVSVPLRNLGASPARQVEVALMFSTGGEDIELARTALAEVPASSDPVPVEIKALAPAGDVALRVVLDPGKKTRDSDRDNNEASVPFKAEGDTVKPTLELRSPVEGVRLADPVVGLQVSAADESGIARVEVRVDQGLWSPLGRSGDGEFTGKALVQPGAHQLTIRAMDASGNRDEKVVNVTVTATPPSVEILEPAEGVTFDTREAKVVARCEGGAVRALARVNGGPWKQGDVQGVAASIPIELPFGEVTIEVMAVDALGMRKTASRRVNCTRQATSDDAQTVPSEPLEGGETGPLDVPGLGPIDPEGTANPVLADPDTSEAAAAPEPVASADPDRGPIATPETSGEHAAVPDDPEEDGSYGSEPFEEEPDPGALEDLDAEEALEDEEIDPEEWLGDPEADTTEDPELATPEVPEDLDYQPPDMESWDEMPSAAEEAPTEDGSAGSSPQGFPPLPPLGDAGGYVGVQQHQADSYCTNRPEVEVKFQMPDQLKKLNIPKPGTKEFEEAFQKRIAALKARGVDTSQLEKLRQILKNRCNRVDMPTELPDFLQSLNIQFGYKAKPDPAELAEWREQMANATDSFMLRLLHSNDPALIAQGLQARMNSLGQFDKAAQESAEGALETVKATQKLTEDFALAVPYLNVAMSARALWSGESMSGEKLGKLDTVMNLLVLAGPAYQLLKNPSLRSLAASIGNKAMWIGEKTIGKLALRLGLTPDRVRAAMQNMSSVLGNARIKAGEKLLGKAWAAEQRFLSSPAGREAAARAARDAKQAESLLHRIAQAQAAGDKKMYRQLIGKLQGNKTAQGLLNSPKFSNAFRNTLDRTHRAMGRLADKGAIRQYMQTPHARKEIEALAKKFGVRAEDIVVRAQNISGNTKRLSNLKPGEMLKYGADRDVVFQFVTKDGKRVLKDVHHKAIEAIYNSNLKRVTGRSMHSMDHVVTSRWNPEAYNAGLNPNTKAGQQAINDIISGKAAGTLKRGSDIRDTVIHKGKEWIEQGKKWAARGAREGKDAYTRIGNQKIKEGMRQMSKEYNRQVAQFLKAKGLDPARAIPPRLRQGLEIFKKVEKGLPVEQAQEMLKALTPKGGVPITPETIAEDLGNFVEFVNKWGFTAGA